MLQHIDIMCEFYSMLYGTTLGKLLSVIEQSHKAGVLTLHTSPSTQISSTTEHISIPMSILASRLKLAYMSYDLNEFITRILLQLCP